MANIYTGNGLQIFYNEDIANRLPQNAGNEKINEIAAMPTLRIASAIAPIETYNSEYSEKLPSEQNVAPIDITVNYIPDDYTHTFLDSATESQEEFQLIMVRRHSEGTLDYSLMNGRIASATLSGDKDAVVQKTYSFVTTEMIVRDATALASVELYEGSYGVGSNGVDVPQYEPITPTGNSFIKVPANQPNNPLGVDMMGVGLIDGDTFSSIAMTKTGNLAIYAKNATNAWQRILTSNLGDSKYVALTGNQSIDGVKTFIKGIYVDSLTASNGISGKSLAVTEGITADNITVTTSTLGTASADSLTLGQPLSVANGGTGAKTPADARKALGVNAAGTFDVVPVLNGGTGATTPIQARLNLGIGSTAGFEVLPIENGGTGAVTALGARNNLELGRIVQSTTETTVQSPDGEKHLTVGNDGWGYWNNETNRFEPLLIGRGGTGANDVAGAKINLQVDRLRQQDNGTFLTSPDYNSSFFVYDGNDWGCIDSATAQVKPLLINYGGTGATTAEGARWNLNINRLVQATEFTLLNAPDNTRLVVANNKEIQFQDQNGIGFGLPIVAGGTGATTAAGARANLELSGFITSSTGSTMRSPNGTFILSIDNNGNWGATERNVSGWKPLGIIQGGTGATTADGARNNLGVGTSQAVNFAQVSANQWSDQAQFNGGVYSSTLYSSTNPSTVRSLGRIYTEIHTDGIPRTTIHSGDGENRNAYLHFNCTGQLSGIEDLHSSNISGSNITAHSQITIAGGNALGARSIAIGDNDTGLKQRSDGILDVYTDSVSRSSFSPSGLTLSDGKIIINHGNRGDNCIYIGTPRDGSSAALIAGIVDGVPNWANWRDRAAGMLVEIPGPAKCVNIWKSVQWGTAFTTSFDTYNPDPNTVEARLNIGNAFFIFQSNGTATATSWVSTSDERLKSNIQPITESLEKLIKLTGYTYDKRSELEPSEYTYTTYEAGLIAQEVQKVLPEAVVESGDDKLLAVNSYAVQALQINAIKELNDKVEDQQKQIDELKALVQSLLNK
ncbi:tail fiber domain-containing protein [Citrobacter werkmanii]|uniref:tail fiber domain-containing protein n=1 Tax=Citrobacter werkmanii TaxID=67827 RepID=UPI002888ACF6|nr:tail fiber domain-containing protein [Citrobacter werkmanii]MDT0637964.1 tail fiber domain-containing protein [Citrobacter werkmanii]